jgi:NTP pyrophosphatase (non-canonical NTP hydrolase)
MNYMKSITFTPDQEKVFTDAISVYGQESQLIQTNEEATELSLAILKYQREMKKMPYDVDEVWRRKQELISEIADVIVMTQQCLLIFGTEEIQQEVNFKLRRQRKRIDKKVNQTINTTTSISFPNPLGIKATL